MYHRQLIPITVLATSPYKQKAPLLVMLRRRHTCHGGLWMRVRAIRGLRRALNALHRAPARLFSASLVFVGGGGRLPLNFFQRTGACLWMILRKLVLCN